MAKDRLPDKLAVILHADVASSTRLVQQDEHLAHERIQEAFRRFSDNIEKYTGKVLELRGDALLAEFERASDAVAAALAFQADQAYHISRLKDDLKPTIRVGVAMGEVVIADNTVTGAGVVLAQRVEQLADLGGLCITAALHESLPRRMPFDLEDLGDQMLKGFDDPVHVYRVELSPGASIPPPQHKSQRKTSQKPWKWIVAIAVVVVMAVGIAYWFISIPPEEEPASIESMAYPLPDKPSIAVLPFTNMSGDAEQEYFADGITEDLITDLSKISGLFVIARNSSFSYKGQQVKVRQVAEELGVRYVLEGSVRRADDQVRINAQLIDATTGGHLWAERYDGLLVDIFELQDRVTTKIVNAMSVTLTPQELELLDALGTSNVTAHDAYLQGLSFYLRNTPTDNAKAVAHLNRAIELDPEFKHPYAVLAKVYNKGRATEYNVALRLGRGESIFSAYRNLAKTVGADIADVHVVRSQMALNKHQVGVALQEAKRALEFSANDVDAMKAKAKALIYSGQFVEGRKLANRIMRLDPAVIAEPLYIIGLSFFASGSYDKAADYAERALENDPTTKAYHLFLAATYGKLGMEKEAEGALVKYRKVKYRKSRRPFWIAAAVYQYPFQDGDILRHLADGFKAAGLAERPPSRYLKLVGETRLSGQEIRALLFGHTTRGQGFWRGLAWEQKRTIDGRFSYSGYSIYTGFWDVKVESESWIEDDRLCDQWSEISDEVTICVLVFHDTDRGPNHYYMMTDLGPHPFQTSN